MKVIYNGVDIYPEISVSNCWHDMYSEKQSDAILLRLNDTAQLWDIWAPKKGDEISIENGNAKTGKMFIESIIPTSGQVDLRAFSAPESVKNKNNKSWESVQFLQLASEISERHGLKLETYGVNDQQYEYVEQNNAPDFAFLQTRCMLEGLAMLVYDGKLVIYDEAYMEAQTPIETLKITPADKFEYNDRGANAYKTGEAVNGEMTGTFTAPNNGDKTFRQILPFRLTNQSEADRFAKGLLRNENKNSTTGIFWSGTLLQNYAAGSVVTLETDGVRSWNGAAFITQIRHDYVKGTSKVFLRKPLEGY